MVVIYGESNSGKSQKALSLLDKKKKSLYFALDFDKKIKSLEIDNKNLQVTAYPRSHSSLVDIEYEILNHGGLFNNKLSYVVIDTINFLNDDKKDLTKFLRRLKKLEKEYKKFEIIAVINKLHHFDLGIEKKDLKGIKFIETVKKEKKKKVINF